MEILNKWGLYDIKLTFLFYPLSISVQSHMGGDDSWLWLLTAHPGVLVSVGLTLNNTIVSK